MSKREDLLRHFDRYREETDRRVAEGIEKNRKGDVALRFVDGSGKPVQGARVKATLKKHAFLFGGNLYGLDQLERPEKNTVYREKFKEVFNMATLPIYWNTLEPEQGKTRYAKDSPFIYRRPPIDLCLEYCEENDIRPKAHCLNYFYYDHYPAWCPRDTDTTEIRRLCEKRFAELAERYRDRIPDWEVINETLGSYIEWDVIGEKQGSRVYADSAPPIFFAPDVIEWSFALADKHFPGNRLIINEDAASTLCDQRGDRSPYYLQIERALSKGARIDAIGLQDHLLFEKVGPKFHAILTAPRKLCAALDLYGQFGLPIQITEITLASFSDEAEDEEAQAELLKELYSLYFSHEAVEAVIYWDLADGYTPGAGPGEMDKGWNVYRGSLLRFDLSEKPAYKMLRHLVKEVWHTEAELVADANGCGGFRGFYGTYTLEVEADGKTVEREVTFTKNTAGELTVVL